MEIKVNIPVVVSYLDPEYKVSATVMANVIERILTRPEYLKKLEAVVEEAKIDAIELLPPKNTK